MSINNPFKKDSLTNIFKKEKKEKDINALIYSQLVGMNRAIDIIAEACACCWDKKIPDSYEDRCEYVAKRVRTGHTSILEHSNFIIYIRVTGSYYITDLIKFLSINKYLNVTTYCVDDKDYRILLSGSYRGYSALFNETDDLNSPIIKTIAGNLYRNASMCAFEDIIKDGLVSKEEFERFSLNTYPESYSNYNLTDVYKHEINDNLEIIGLDNYEKLVNNLYEIDPDFVKAVDRRDLIKHVTVTVLFKNMSRIITQQLCRHRNAITQESQRYVDYSKASFNSPALFKYKIDPDFKYRIKFGSSTMEMNLQEIGDAEVGIYNTLHSTISSGAHALVPEDARAFLPGNVQCRKIYMTFTYDRLFKFLLLREASGAQAEIRGYAQDLGNWFRKNTQFNSKEITDLFTRPRLFVQDPVNTIDVVDLGTEELEEITEEDYIKAAGLQEEE